MSNFWARTITGLSMVFLILAALGLNIFFFAALFLIVTVLGLLEFYSITVTEECKPQKITGTILGTIVYLMITGLFLFRGFDALLLSAVVIFPVFFIPIIIEVYRKKEKPLINAAVTIFGMIYIAVPLSLLPLMNNSDGGTVLLHFPAYLTAYFLITWIYDTGAYLVGKNFGKHKFFERISPKKTWEGTIGGATIAIAAATGFFFISEDIRLIHLIVLTFLVILFGTFGDLAESLFKRSLNLKDSGKILPGHGGILDRFDTLFVSAPFVFLYFVFQIIL
ncbi:MAG: phosphatidate cytidylyltransferase [Bacteroidetes bacterium]|nr:phosphatidate cytidylyltransferase [Bacteroidota bacterium]